MTRKDTILKLIVQHFIKSAEPVGSKTLVDEYNLDLSSATIRADMSDLEKEGFLEKQHTSGGRVPTKKGYEYYVSNLREKNINEDVKMRLQKVMDKKVESIENIIKESCSILTEMTNLASVVVGPNKDEEYLVSVQIVPISNNSATAIFVTDKGYVENKTFLFQGDTSVNDVTNCVKLLNDRLKGTKISELVAKMEALRPILSDYVIDHDVIYQALLETFQRFASDRLELYGRDVLLSQPEFKNDAQRVKKMIEIISNPNLLKEEISKGVSNDDNVSVRIADNKNNDMSIVSASISIDGMKEGTISLLGPTRMDYDKAVSLLSYVANTLTEHFNNNLKGGNTDGRRENVKKRSKERNEIKRKS